MIAVIDRNSRRLSRLSVVLLGAVSGSAIAQPPTQVATQVDGAPARGMIIEEDIIVPLDFFAPRGTFSTNLWPGGVVPYEFDANVTPENQGYTLAAMNEWETRVPVDFVPRTSEANYIHVQDSTGNSSYVGMIGGGQPVNIRSWTTRMVICHELGHALGVWHEQSRPDRDAYIQINYENIQAGREHNFFTRGESYGPYDFDSVMHYNRCAFSVCCPAGSSCDCEAGCQTITVLPPYESWQSLIGQRDHLSAGDVATITWLYSPHPPPANDNCADALPVGEGATPFSTHGATADGVEGDPCFLSSGFVGADIWYRFNAVAGGPLTVDTCTGTAYDSIVAVYEDVGTCPPTAATGLACNDDACSVQSRVDLTVVQGRSYVIRLGGWSGSFGSGILTIVGPCAALASRGGDANCDGAVNNFDIDAFVLALSGGQAAWSATYLCNYLCANDMNRDFGVNNFDIDAFVDCLATGNCP